MSITDKTRKILWAKSGNKCALCDSDIICANQNNTSNVVIGEECHIISKKTEGPRGKVTHEYDDLDCPDNLILLCANCHKKIDDDENEYTKEKLIEIKKTHEKNIQNSLYKKENKIVRFNQLTNGKQIIDLLRGTSFGCFDYDRVFNDIESELIGSFLGNIKDVFEASLLDIMEITDITKLNVDYTKDIEKLEKLGFLVFGNKRKVKNISLAITGYSISLLVIRKDNPAICGKLLSVSM